MSFTIETKKKEEKLHIAYLSRLLDHYFVNKIYRNTRENDCNFVKFNVLYILKYYMY